ncbi:MAG: NYN domain-containing protein [Saprospiraceae bacterium]
MNVNPVSGNKLLKIGVFYDGNYFLHVSNYYNYEHERRARLSVAGLHGFIRQTIAREEGIDKNLCQVVDAHYFRGRLRALEAKQTNKLYPDRIFDDILMSEGVITHYLPVRKRNGKLEEKGIDVWLALEAFELSIYKRFDVVVLIAADGDYVSLIRKLNSLGTRVMILSWDFEYTTESGKTMITRTSQELLEEVSYPIAMHEVIDNRVRKNDPFINNLFETVEQPKKPTVKRKAAKTYKGKIVNMRNGFGFISRKPTNLFFHYTDVIEGDFNDIRKGDEVKYQLGKNQKGETVAKMVQKVE